MKSLGSRFASTSLLVLTLAFAGAAAGQDQDNASKSPTPSTLQEDVEANPGRPTVATPATLTPVGYFQFESGVLGAGILLGSARNSVWTRSSSFP